MIHRQQRTAVAAMLIATLTLMGAHAFAQNNGGQPMPNPNQPDQQEVDLPVTRAVLYSSGVGYFEHEGEIEGDRDVRLLFKTDQINDVLKSMVVMDAGGGTASAVSYPSNDPLERSLQSFSIDLSGQPTLPQLLSQLRGAQVTVFAPEPVTGRILGVDTRTRVIGEPPAEVEEHFLNLVTDTGLVSLPMSSVDRFVLADPKLQDELTRALLMIGDARDKDRKPVEIRFSGEGRRKVRIGYLIETPVWKTSYRLDLSAAGENEALLQGWAIAENTSGSDWRNVGLSLVSGRPISFIQDLYTPLYLDRPVVQPELYASLRPQRYDDGIATGDEVDQLKAQYFRSEERKRASVAGKMMDAAEAAPAPMAPAMSRGVAGLAGGGGGGGMSLQANAAASVASASDLGELFQYAIAAPVSLPRRTSAMLPILNQQVKTEKVSIYNQQALAKHPLSGALVTNESTLKLMAGPMTVFEDGAYAGDAQLDHLAPGEQRMISYAVDLAVTVDPSVTSHQHITTARIVNGVLYVARVTGFEQNYLIKNKAAKDRAILIEHPFIADRKLMDPKEPLEKTPNLYRFRVEVKADTTGKFTVKEQQPHTQTIAILSTNVGSLQWYTTSGEIPANVREALKTAITLKNELSELQTRLQQEQRRLVELQQGQGRLRENINTVGSGSTLGKRYIQKLAEQEDQIEKLQTEIFNLEEAVEKKQKQLNDYLVNLDVTP